ncbi:MAG: SRPBCC domain-containing protein [Rhodospirillales bacterium]|nr:SRPBCC domain-containing protein [Rhodospirillales bacterium]
MNETTYAPRGLTSRAARVVPAPPADVFRALTDAQSIAKWWGKTGKTTLTVCDMDVRYGGTFRFSIRAANDAEAFVNGHYFEVDPPYRLAFTWSSEKPADNVIDSRVTIELHDLEGQHDPGCCHPSRTTRAPRGNALQCRMARHAAGHEPAFRCCLMQPRRRRSGTAGKSRG